MFAKKFLFVLLLTQLVLAYQVASAAILSVPEHYPTIATALQHAENGDQILLSPGTYFEYDLIMPAGITLSATSTSPGATTIDARNQGRILSCKFLDTPVQIQNLTFQNGLANGESSYDRSGGAIFLLGCSATIRNCHFIANHAETHGGAIRCIKASPKITNCIFRENTAPDGGGGALDCSYNASPQLRGCFFTGNSSAWGGALACRGNSNPELLSCIFGRNEVDSQLAYGGAALSFFDSTPEFTSCTFYRNNADFGGAMATLDDSPAALTNCTLTQNQAALDGGGVYSESAPTEISTSIITFHEGSGVSGIGEILPTIACTNIFGNSAGDLVGDLSDYSDRNGNISADPLYCDHGLDLEFVFFVDPDSPCAAANTDCGTLGAWPASCGEDPDDLPLSEPPRILSIENIRAWPNPFNPSTSIHFELVSSQNIRLDIFDIRGQRIASLANELFEAGQHDLTWNGRDNCGRVVGSGTYFFLIRGEAEVQKRKITLLK